MKGPQKSKVFALGIFLTAIPPAVPLFAHHGGASLYEMSKEVTVEGTVTEFSWTNPHVEISLDAKDDKGKVKHYLLEVSSPPVLVSHGWNRKSVQIGDVIKVTFNPSQKGVGVGRFIKLVKADGTQLDSR